MGVGTEDKRLESEEERGRAIFYASPFLGERVLQAAHCPFSNFALFSGTKRNESYRAEDKKNFHGISIQFFSAVKMPP